jgi:hemerythrin-like domain-containing protein
MFMDEATLLKRSIQLQPLSREHHEGLLFVSQIRQGLLNDTRIDKLQKHVRWFWKQHVRPHFFQEEKILLPYLPADHPLAKKLKDDHTEIRELMLSIDRDVDHYDITSLTNLIERHICWEEREFFQYLESTLSVTQLENIYEELNNHPVSCTVEWKDVF